MANKRIKDLSTTAAVTASDDFIAVDGATNGTRKLNAYSPTFGGNLTVSGTTASTNDTSGAFQVIGGAGLKSSAYINTNGDTGRALVVGPVQQAGGNLPYASIKTSASFADFALGIENPNTTAGQGLGLRIVAGAAANDFPIYVRNQANNSTLFSVGGTGNGILSGNLTVSGGTITSGSGTLTLNSSANTVVLQSAGTTALTLDSSQRCILAGALRLNNAYTASAVVPTGYVTIQDSTGTTYKVCVLL